MIEHLLKEGAKVRAFDPVARRDVMKIFGKRVKYAKDAYDCAKGSDAVVIVTEWNEFRNLDLVRIKKLLNTPLFFDLRNIYEPGKLRDLGFRYFCVGRM